ncbi:DMT family transporter [Peteryoungia algae]|uniref:DMT family transporter n=1 Tax=Peteryoungia algae TaxID=2919917 RepID=A0ABT0CWC6_9HYPH|nr:DMT family transporter [Rhizobium sp. SSM4.3]MCJ8237465.1 DMT family transporter [Rhizobium sp. SSM4.3]
MRNSALVAFCFLGLVWGSNFIFVKWAALHITPVQITLLRVIFGFIPVVVYALWRGDLRWSQLRHGHHFVIMALLATALYYYAFARGTVLLPSGVAGMLSGAIPLFTLVCAFLFLREEPLGRGKMAGLVLGFLGVLLVAQPWSATGQIDIDGIGWMIGGSLSVGCSFVYARKFISPLKLPAAALTTWQIGIGMVLLALVTPLQGIGAVFDDHRAAAGLILGLGLCGTGLAYVAYYHIVETLGALAASSVTYVPPVVALLIGVALVGETIPLSGYIALVSILAGVGLIQWSSVRGYRAQRL